MGSYNPRYVEILRHSIKDKTPGKTYQLSTKGKELGIQRGQEYLSKYAGKKFRLKGSNAENLNGYIGRAAESARYVGYGLQVPYEELSDVVDSRLAYHITPSEDKVVGKLMKEGKMTELEIILESCEESMYKDNVRIAQFIDQHARGNSDVVTIGVSHSGNIAALGYMLLNGDKNKANVPIAELTGIQFAYDSAKNQYTIKLEYLGGDETVVVKGSLAKEVYARMKKLLAEKAAKNKKKDTKNLEAKVEQEQKSEGSEGESNESGESDGSSESSGESGDSGQSE